MSDAALVIRELEALATPSELPKVRARLADDEPAFGLRMRDLFATAKAHADLGLDEVGRLLDHAAYEPRMAGFCILDFKARKNLTKTERQDLADIYLDRHDRITTWTWSTAPRRASSVATSAEGPTTRFTTWPAQSIRSADGRPAPRR